MEFITFVVVVDLQAALRPFRPAATKESCLHAETPLVTQQNMEQSHFLLTLYAFTTATRKLN